MAERQAFGIDINEYSRTGGIYYELAKAHLLTGNFDFIIIKAGLGLAESTLFPEQRQNIEFQQIPYATYHFLDPRWNIKDQMKSYVNWVGVEQSFYIIDIESPAAGLSISMM